MNKVLTIATGIALLILLLLYSMTYTVAYHEVAVITRFGQLSSVRTDPGLAMKLPFFADRVTKFDTRLQMAESPMKTIQTADDEQLVVRLFLMWQIDTDRDDGPTRFFTRYATMTAAMTFLESQLEDAAGQLSRYTFSELVGDSTTMEEAERQILAYVRDQAAEYGIDAQFAGVSQVLLPPRTARAVLERMRATRQALAQAERIKGVSESQSIQAELRTKMGKIQAFAMQRAAEIRAEAAARSAEYIRQLNEEPELAIFLTWLNAAEEALSKYTTVVLDANFGPPFHVMNLASRVNSKGIPLPHGDYRLAGEIPARPELPLIPNPSEYDSDDGDNGDADDTDPDEGEPQED